MNLKKERFEKMEHLKFKIGDRVEFKPPGGRVIGYEKPSRSDIDDQLVKVMRDDTGEVVCFSPYDLNLIEPTNARNTDA